MKADSTVRTQRVYWGFGLLVAGWAEPLLVRADYQRLVSPLALVVALALGITVVASRGGRWLCVLATISLLWEAALLIFFVYAAGHPSAWNWF